ncbi:arginine N-succinyltransferase [Chlamydiales bacterium]|nr:arginine N-succinyltransferase [Chlamydiales bacterium]
MVVLRQAKNSDLNSLIELSKSASLGVVNFPKDKDALAEKIKKSEESFNKKVIYPGDELYLFVLEDQESGQVVGVSSIKALSPFEYPTSYFRIENERIKEGVYPSVKEIKTLNAKSDVLPATELCSLFLHPTLRHEGGGRLLSLGRLIYIANHPERFSNTIFADLRGVILKDETSPFWDAIGKFFSPVSFKELNDLYLKNPEGLNSILPKYPIYIPLLSPSARKSIGQPHKRSVGALKFLEEEGFLKTPYIHPMDGGPRAEGSLKNIRAIQESETTTIKRIVIKKREKMEIIATTSSPFRACLGHVLEKGIISTRVATKLELQEGDLCRYIKKKK